MITYWVRYLLVFSLLLNSTYVWAKSANSDTIGVNETGEVSTEFAVETLCLSRAIAQDITADKVDNFIDQCYQASMEDIAVTEDYEADTSKDEGK